MVLLSGATIMQEEMLLHMEAMATQIWPRVEAGEE
jgi:hypothetical protein